MLSADLHSSVPGVAAEDGEEEGGPVLNSSDVMWPLARFQILNWF